jgi:hypothetical protein
MTDEGEGGTTSTYNNKNAAEPKKHKHTYKQTNKQTNKHTYIHSHKHTYNCFYKFSSKPSAGVNSMTDCQKIITQQVA